MDFTITDGKLSELFCCEIVNCRLTGLQFHVSDTFENIHDIVFWAKGLHEFLGNSRYFSLNPAQITKHLVYAFGKIPVNYDSKAISLTV